MKRLGEPIGIRLPEGDAQLLKQVCESRGENVSNFVRRCIRKELATLSFYDAATKKALGVQPEHEPRAVMPWSIKRREES